MRQGGRIAGALAATLLANACVAPREAPPPASAATAPVRATVPPVQLPGATPRAPYTLISRITALGRSFDGKVGIAVRDVHANWTVSFNGTAAFPQQSVSKLWVAMTVLDAVDRGAMSLGDEVVVRTSDLVVFNQPSRQFVGPDGWRTTVHRLLQGAMSQSDNLCNDVLLWKVGGPEAVRAFLARNGLGAVGFGPGEARLQARIAGLEWNDAWRGGQGFLAARARLSYEERARALQRYVDAPYDGATPEAITLGLAKLRQGQLLSPASSQTLLTFMAQSKTGPQRIKGGVAPDWAYAHKTGTGQELGKWATGYNDVGIMTAPDGRTYSVAVMIASTTQPIPVRWQLMQSVARAVIESSPAERMGMTLGQ